MLEEFWGRQENLALYVFLKVAPLQDAPTLAGYQSREVLGLVTTQFSRYINPNMLSV